MEFKGTKGEWKVDDESVVTINTVDGDIVCEAPEAWAESMENWEANAKLISAAPDMLEALQISKIALIEHGFTVESSTIISIDKAIKKALGT